MLLLFHHKIPFVAPSACFEAARSSERPTPPEIHVWINSVATRPLTFASRAETAGAMGCMSMLFREWIKVMSTPSELGRLRPQRALVGPCGGRGKLNEARGQDLQMRSLQNYILP